LHQRIDFGTQFGALLSEEDLPGVRIVIDQQHVFHVGIPFNSGVPEGTPRPSLHGRLVSALAIGSLPGAASGGKELHQHWRGDLRSHAVGLIVERAALGLRQYSSQRICPSGHPWRLPAVDH
jgi:hypothetical protein